MSSAMPASLPRASNGNMRERSTAGLAALRRFTRGQAPARGPARRACPPTERCELCGEGVLPEHHHLLDRASHALVCACATCSVLFDHAPTSAPYRLVPDRYLALPGFQMTDGQWDELAIPVGMAFLVRGSGERPIQAFYPSPAGPMESLLDLSGWDALVQGNPVLRDLEPEVEALLINRVRQAREHYIVPLDACYRLVGLIRASWKGLGGGDAVWEAIAAYFGELRKRAFPVGGAWGGEASEGQGGGDHA